VPVVPINDLKDKKELEDHLMSLNLLSGSEDDDTFTLRQIFVEELIRGEEEYTGFLSAESMRTLTERANDLACLIVKLET